MKVVIVFPTTPLGKDGLSHRIVTGLAYADLDAKRRGWMRNIPALYSEGSRLKCRYQYRKP